MNILPLILALVLVVSVLTVERLEKFKNQSIIQKEYQQFLKESERQVFNQREKRLFKQYDKDLKQLTFRYIFDKEAREKHPNEAKQYRMLLIDLMKIVYGEAAFYKKLVRENDKFLEEMLTAVEKAADEAADNTIRQTKDIARLDLGEPELQEAFYFMLKGTIERDKLMELIEEKEITPKMKEKAYVSLFTFIDNEGAKDKVPAIRVALAPREILKAIFEKDEVVEEILVKRVELGAKDKDSGADETFKNAFLGKVRQGLDVNLLDFKLSKNSDEYE